MRQDSIIQFYFAIIMALFLVGCEKDNLKTMSEKGDQLSLETAKSYFEQSYISETATKSGADIDLKGRLFYPGDFTPQWDKAIYSENAVFEGYDVNMHLPKYKYVVEREYYEKGEIKTFEVPVSQRLVVRKEEATGMMSHYILSLIPDKYYHEKTKESNIISLSHWEDFSGIAIYSNPQTGVPMSVARYVNGRKFSSVQMLAITQEGMIDNAKRAYMILGPMKIKSKIRVITKSAGCGGDGDYGDGPYWQLHGFTHIIGGYYWDGQDVWEDVDGDGVPDYICMRPVYVEGEKGGGSDDPVTPPEDPSEEPEDKPKPGGGGGSPNNPDGELNDEEMLELGYRGIEKIEADIIDDDFRVYTTGVSVESPFTFLNTVVSVEGVWISWLNAFKGMPDKLMTFGKNMGYLGLGVGIISSYETVMIVLDEGWEHLTTGEKLELVSLGLQGAGLLVGGLVPVIGPVLGAATSSVGTVVGIVSLGINQNVDTLLKIELSNNLSFTIYLV